MHATTLNTHSTPDITVFKISQPERYLRVGYRPNKGDTSTSAISLCGVATGSQVQHRAAAQAARDAGCLIITTQDICELWFMLPGLSRSPFDERTTAEWLGAFPSELDLAGITGSD
ncbi:type I toxin-antitoxin system SymE family toxin [Erwinia sp. 9145]|uniref:type I toxin-antitoxin system SymE family toxin n=1 Tax=Erwinia sp. 9145 TaxID=1500895 RepID=UPI000B242426|nr:type I toxin-antitoxin system SymE family toxin [Erwinia sp. 9145]